MRPKLTALRGLALISGAAALAWGTTAALAQNQPEQTAATAAPAGGLEEVVVTARYREENLQQTPIAISAITSEEIQERNFTTTADIGYEVPNASLRPAQAAFGNTMTAYIRGVGQYDFNFAFEPGVAIYVDDVYYPTVMGTQTDLMDLARVEVLRGPQGTLFGRGAIGGAIRYVSRQPTGSNTGFAEATVGDFHRVDVRAGFDFSIIPDKLFARVTGVSKKQDGYQKVIDFACANPTLAGSLPATTHNRAGGCQTGTLGGTDMNGARGVARYVISDTADVTVALDYQRDDSPARADALIGIGPSIPSVAAWDQFMFNGTIPLPNGATARPNPNFQGYGVHYDSRFLPPNPFISYATFNDPYSGLSFPPRTSLNQKGVSGTLSWQLTDAVNARFIVAWRNWNSFFSTDQDVSPLGFSVVDGIQHFTYRTGELQLSGRLFDRLDWTAGAFYYHGNGLSSQQVELPAFMGPRFYSPNPALASTTYTQNPIGSTTTPTGQSIPNSLLVYGLDNGRFENTSGFLHAVYGLTGKWRITGGARYSSDKKHDDFDNTIFRAPVDSNADHFDWLAGTDYQLTDTTMVYFTASTGYRPPAFNPRPFQASQFVAVQGEEMTAFELGIKADLFDRKLRVNAAGFYNDYNRRIVPVAGTDCVTGVTPCIVIPRTNYVNSPGKISGGELEVVVRPFTGLTLDASAGYTKFTAENPATGGITFSGSPIYVPKWNAAASVQYAALLPNGATITPRWDSYLQTEICSGVQQSSCAPGYVLHNARIEFADSERTWVAAAGLSNVTDKVYLLNIFDLTGFGEPTIEGQPGMPRAWYFSLTRNFK